MAKNEKNNKHHRMWAWSSSCCAGSCWVLDCLCGLHLSFQPYGDSSLGGWLASLCRGDASWSGFPKGQKVGTDWKVSQALRASDMAENPRSSTSHSLCSDGGLMGSSSQPVFQPLLGTLVLLCSCSLSMMAPPPFLPFLTAPVASLDDTWVQTQSEGQVPVCAETQGQLWKEGVWPARRK